MPSLRPIIAIHLFKLRKHIISVRHGAREVGTVVHTSKYGPRKYQSLCPLIESESTINSIRKIVPPDIQVSAVSGDIIDATLWGTERDFINRFAPGRLAEFATTRTCARAAIIRLGRSPRPIPRGIDGAPVWPNGVVGSMTHCPGVRAVAVGHSSSYEAIGIDAEPAFRIPTEIIPLIATTREQKMLETLDRDAPEVPWSRLLFSAKESAYKAWHSLGGSWLNFDECEIYLKAGSMDFSAQILSKLSIANKIRSSNARWHFSDANLFTAVSIAGSTENDSLDHALQ